MTKTCTQCQVDKPLSDYHKNKNRKDGHVGICKSCAISKTKDWQSRNPEKLEAYAAVRVIRRHNITQEKFDQLVLEQNGCCAVCGNKDVKLVIDHDHACCPGDYSCGDCVRGLLCNNCNTAIGLMKDNTETMQAAIQYLMGA